MRICSISYTRVKIPIYKSKEVSLVIIYGLSDELMILLTNLEIKGKESFRKSNSINSN